MTPQLGPGRQPCGTDCRHSGLNEREGERDRRGEGGGVRKKKNASFTIANVSMTTGGGGGGYKG